MEKRTKRLTAHSQKQKVYVYKTREPLEQNLIIAITISRFISAQGTAF